MRCRTESAVIPCQKWVINPDVLLEAPGNMQSTNLALRVTATQQMHVSTFCAPLRPFRQKCYDDTTFEAIFERVLEEFLCSDRV